jgi:hypothetical protein
MDDVIIVNCPYCHNAEYLGRVNGDWLIEIGCEFISGVEYCYNCGYALNTITGEPVESDGK